MRLYNWLSEATIATAATTAGTYTFTPSMLPSGRGVAQFSLRFTGTNMTLVNVDRYRVKAGSTVIVDAESEDSVQAWLQRITNGISDYADADTAITLPFFDPRIIGIEKYGGQFPFHLGAPQVEVTINATPGAGTIGISAVIVEGIPLTHYHSFICSRMEIAASSTNGRADLKIPPGAALKGFTINTTGLDRLQITVNNMVRGLWTGVSLIESQRLFNSDVLTNPIGAILEVDQIAGIGGQELLLSTAAGWAGVANEFGVWAFHPMAA